MRITTGETPALPIFLVDETDKTTPVTGASVAVSLSVNGAAQAAGLGTVAEVADGLYTYTPDDTETDFAGFIFLWGSAPGSAEWRDYHTVENHPLASSVPGSFASGTAGNALGRIGPADITVVSPVSESGDITIVAGDSYVTAKGTALSWTSSDFPDLTGATLSFLVDTLEATPVCSNPGEAEQTITVELTAEQTATLSAVRRPYPFDIEATYTGGIVVTVVRGEVSVLAD